MDMITIKSRMKDCFDNIEENIRELNKELKEPYPNGVLDPKFISNMLYMKATDKVEKKYECPACGSQTFRPWPDGNGYDIGCSTCEIGLEKLFPTYEDALTFIENMHCFIKEDEDE